MENKYFTKALKKQVAYDCCTFVTKDVNDILKMLEDDIIIEACGQPLWIFTGKYSYIVLLYSVPHLMVVDGAR